MTQTTPLRYVKNETVLEVSILLEVVSETRTNQEEVILDKTYKYSVSWSDSDTWNPSSKLQNTESYGSLSTLLDILRTVELTSCKDVTIIISNDIRLQQNLDILIGKKDATPIEKREARDKIAPNSEDWSQLSRLFKVLNISIP